MGLIDYQIGFSRLVNTDIRHPAKRRARGKDVIVIADNNVRFTGAVELQLKRADLVLLSQVAKRAGLQFPFLCQQSENPLFINLSVVIASILTVVGVAQRLVLEAYLALGGDREGFEFRTRLLKAGDGILRY